jgi:hypothetical protein
MYLHRFSNAPHRGIVGSYDPSYFFRIGHGVKNISDRIWPESAGGCQTDQGISVVDEDNELKFSKLFLAARSKV